MGTPEAIRIQDVGINPLEYKLDPTGESSMNGFEMVLTTVGKRPDFLDISRTGSYSVVNMNREEGELLCSIGETLYKYGLPCVISTLTPRNDTPYSTQEYIVTENGTILGNIVQNGLHRATIDYRSKISEQPYSELRKKELVNEFVLRGVRQTYDHLTESGWKPLRFGVLI